MKYLVETLGLPDQELLNTGAYTQRFFVQEQGADGPRWRFMVSMNHLLFSKLVDRCILTVIVNCFSYFDPLDRRRV